MRTIVLVLFFIVGKAAMSQERPTGVSGAVYFVDSVFTSPTVTIGLNELRPSDSLLAIMEKFNNAIEANKDWAADYMNKYYKPGEGMPYNEKFGITKDEYEKIRTSDASSYRLRKVKTEKLFITNTNLAITFKGTDSFRILNFLQFQKGIRCFVFGGDTVTFAGEITAPTSTPFGSWHGYRWHFEKANQNEDSDININQLSGKIIEIDLGKTIPGDRIFLRIEYQQIENGEKKAYMDMIGFINNL